MDQAIVLQYLSKYLIEPRVLPTLSIHDPFFSELPEWWHKILFSNGKERIKQTLESWEKHRAQLPSVFRFISTYLQSVNLVTDKNLGTDKLSYRLLYELEKDGRTMYYAGGNPLCKSMGTSVREAWDKLPMDFRRFYDSFHNGWYYLASKSMGPSPIEDFFVLDEMEWGILEDIDVPGCDLKDLLAVYTNGMGSYVAISIERKQACGDVLWRKDKPPRLNIDAWAVMDAWTEIGLSK
jgi:hypothetical protein